MSEFLIYGEISEWGVEAKEIAAFLQQAKKDKEESVTFRVNSIGGDIFEAIAMASLIESAEMKTIAIIDSIAASSAGFVVCAVDWVMAAADSSFQLHNPRPYAAQGDADTLQSLVDTLRQYESTFKKKYAKKTGLSEEELTELMAGDEGTLMTAQEALKLGFVDEIIEPLKIDAKAPKKFLAKYKKPEKKQVPKAPKKNIIRSKAMTREDFYKKYQEERGLSPEMIDAMLADMQALDEEGATPTETKETCEAGGKFWYDDACHAEAKPDDGAAAAAPAPDEEGATPMTKADCDTKGWHWYGDACHEDPEPEADASASENAAVIALQKKVDAQTKTIADQKQTTDNLVRDLAIEASEKVFSNYQANEDEKTDIRALVCHKKFIKDGSLDKKAYQKALAAKTKAHWGSANKVEGVEASWSEPSPATEDEIKAKAKAKIMELRGKK